MIYTVGYEGLSLPAFWDLLRDNDIKTLVDVRAVPLSRKPGFSKSALAAGCGERGLDYLHLRALGCPRFIRDSYKASKDWDEYTTRFLAYLEGGEADGALHDLAGLVQSSRCALMCFEADPMICHRLYVAEEISARLEQENVEARIFHLRTAQVIAG